MASEKIKTEKIEQSDEVQGLAKDVKIKMLKVALSMCDDIVTRKYSNPTDIVNCVVKIFEATKE